MVALKAWWSLEALYYQFEVLTLAVLLVFLMVACAIRLKLPERSDHLKAQQAIEELKRKLDTHPPKERHHVR